MFSSSFNCRRYTLLPPPSSNDNQLHIQSIWFDLSYESNFFPHENSVIFRFSRQRIVGEKLPRNTDNDFERYSTLDESKRFSIESSIITFPHWTNVREREKERGKKKKGEGRKKWTQVQINLIPWKQRIEWYVRSRLRENPVTIVTRFAKCVLSLSRALTPVIDEYKANILRPRKLGNGRKGAAWRASPNGKFSEENKEREILQFPFFSLSLSRDWTRSTKRSD